MFYCLFVSVLENKSRKDIVRLLIDRKYDPDPVKTWKEKSKRQEGEEGAETPGEANGEQAGDGEAENGDDEEGVEGAIGTASEAAFGGTKGALIRPANYDYLMGMAFWNLSKEKKDELLRQRDQKRTELNLLSKMTPDDLWLKDLDEFMEKLDVLKYSSLLG